MTIITVDFKGTTETIRFDPPLPPAKEMQFIGYHGRLRSVAIFCDIVGPLSSYSNFEKDAFGPSQLLTVVPSQECPIVKAKKSKDPINSMKFDLIEEERSPPKNIRKRSFVICLKIYH